MNNFSNIPAKDDIEKSGLYKVDHRTNTMLEPDRTVYYNLETVPENLIDKAQLKKSLKAEDLKFEAIIRTRNSYGGNPNYIVFGSDKDGVYRFRYNDASDLHYKNGPEVDLNTAISKAECFGYFESKKVFGRIKEDTGYAHLYNQYEEFYDKMVKGLDTGKETEATLFGTTYTLTSFGSRGDIYAIKSNKGFERNHCSYEQIIDFLNGLESKVNQEKEYVIGDSLDQLEYNGDN